MAARFEFATATRVLFGAGTLGELGGIARDLGRRALGVTGRSETRAQPALANLAGQGIRTVLFSVPGEPDIGAVNRGVELARREGCDLVVAVGGGSAIDAGKAIGGLLGNGGEVLDYLEVIGKARPLTKPSIPVVAVPTTAGTGCEVTRNAVLASPEHRFKASLRSPFLLPRVAIVDPFLTLGLPPDITASTGLDALTQLIEPFLSSRANPMTDALCREGIRAAAKSLAAAWAAPDDVLAREGMALASLLGGMALANAGLGAVHGFAAPLGGMFPVPHGAVCAALLPHVMAGNLAALRQRAPESPALVRFSELGVLLTGQPGAGAEEALSWVADLCRRLRIPSLGAYGISRAQVGELVEKAGRASSMKANPIQLAPSELTQILLAAL